MEMLKSLSPIDGTFNQGAAVDYACDMARSGLPSFAFDLSAATDRLPIDVQVQVLTILSNSRLASEWKNLLVGREWYLKGQPLKYGVGQPMGAYSS